MWHILAGLGTRTASAWPPHTGYRLGTSCNRPSCPPMQSHASRGDPAMWPGEASWLWSLLKGPPLAAGHREHPMAWLLRPFIVEAHPTQKELIFSFSPTGTAFLFFPVTTITLASEPQETCFFSPFPFSYLNPSMVTSNKCSLPLPDFTVHTLAYLLPYCGFVVLFQGGVFSIIT